MNANWFTVYIPLLAAVLGAAGVWVCQRTRHHNEQFTPGRVLLIILACGMVFHITVIGIGTGLVLGQWNQAITSGIFLGVAFLLFRNAEPEPAIFPPGRVARLLGAVRKRRREGLELDLLVARERARIDAIENKTVREAERLLLATRVEMELTNSLDRLEKAVGG